MVIDGPGFEAVPEREDERRVHAAHFQPAKHAEAIQRTGWIHGLLRRVTKDAIAVLVEDEPMQIYKTAGRISKHPVPIGVSCAVGAGVALGHKHFLEGGKVVELHREIEVGVRPRLFGKKRINAPAAVDPEGEACSVEGSAKFNHVLKFHR